MTSILHGERDGWTFHPPADASRLNAQAVRVFEVMRDGEWHTLAEMSATTGDPEASISARFRDFRKGRFGHMAAISERIKDGGGQWRYRLERGTMPNVAKLYPARTDDNGVTWYRAGTAREDGWTSNPDYAHPDYFAPAQEAQETPPPQPQEENDMGTQLTADLDRAPLTTEWEGFPLPPEPDRPKSKFNGWGWYQLPAPTTGMTTGFPRATTIADTLDEMYGLNRWKRRETAKRLLQLAQMEPDEIVWGEWTAGKILERVRAAQEAPKVTELDNTLDVMDNMMGGAYSRELGECAHAWLGAIHAGTALLRDVPEVVQVHVRKGMEVLAHRGIEVLPEYTERTILNDQGEETVAGKIDGIGRLLTTGELVLLDVKTNKDLQYSWLSYGVQVGGVYGWATKVLSLDGKSWEPFPEVREDFAVLLHIPSDQPEHAAAITIDKNWGGETMIVSLETRRRRKEAKVEVPKHAIPVPSAEAIRYCEARNALSAIESLEQGQAIYEDFQDVWDDDLDEHAGRIAQLLDL